MAVLSTGCASGKRPTWNGSIYFGDAAKEGVTREGSNPDFIGARDPRFEGMVCFPGDDFKTFTATYIDGCREWR